MEINKKVRIKPNLTGSNWHLVGFTGITKPIYQNLFGIKNNKWIGIQLHTTSKGGGELNIPIADLEEIK